MADVVVVYTTWPDAEKAEAAGAEAVAERLAACANLHAPIRSIYRWEGALERTAEIAMTLKTTDEAAPALVALLLQRHPDEVPCILGWRTEAALSHAGYLDWVTGETTPGPDEAMQTLSDEPISSGEV